MFVEIKNMSVNKKIRATMFIIVSKKHTPKSLEFLFLKNTI